MLKPPAPPQQVEEFIRGLPKPPSALTKLEDVPRLLQDQGLLLDDLNVRVGKLVKLMTTMVGQMQLVPQGIVCTMEKTITGNRVTRIRLKEEPEADHRPWFSATITNDEDSAGDVWVAVNNPHKRFRKLRPSERAEVDFHAPKVEDIYARCDSAEGSALLVIQGDY